MKNLEFILKTGSERGLLHYKNVDIGKIYYITEQVMRFNSTWKKNERRDKNLVLEGRGMAVY